MADALTKAPEKKETKYVEFGKQKVIDGSNEHISLTTEYDPAIKYMFHLATPNLERELPVMMIENNKARLMPHQEYKPYQNIVLTSQIIWNNARTVIRYYDGCESIFVSEQPKEKDVLDQLMRQTQPKAFLEGKFGCFGDEKMLLLYLNICSWNGESPFRTRTANAIFVPVNKGKKATAEGNRLDQTEKALKLAKEASFEKMVIHGGFLGIPTMDFDSGNDLIEEEIRIAYRKEALRNSAYFIETYGNKAIEIKYYINKALGAGVISNKANPNKATWGANDTVICDISGLKSPEAIGQRIFEFSQTSEGEEFAIQLAAIYKK